MLTRRRSEGLPGPRGHPPSLACGPFGPSPRGSYVVCCAFTIQRLMPPLKRSVRYYPGFDRLGHGLFSRSGVGLSATVNTQCLV
jgi:hypothetical protein